MAVGQVLIIWFSRNQRRKNGDSVFVSCQSRGASCVLCICVFFLVSLSAPPLFSSARAARRKQCQWHMACHCAKHPYYRQVHQSQLWPCERRVWVPDRWCLELTCCYDITTETLGSPQKPTPILETAKREIPRLEVPTESAELQQIIDKLFKPSFRDPGSEPRTCQLMCNICHTGNECIWVASVRFWSFKAKCFRCKSGHQIGSKIGSNWTILLRAFSYFYEERFVFVPTWARCFSAKFNRRLWG